MRYSKHNIIEKCLQLIECSNESYEKLIINRAVRGEKEFTFTASTMKTPEYTAWLFGFLSHFNSDELAKLVVYGLKRNWFYDNSSAETEDILRQFLMDILMSNKDTFSDISDWYIRKYPKHELSKDLLSIVSATGLTSLSIDEINNYRYGS